MVNKADFDADPVEYITLLVNERQDVPDEAILAELIALPVLPDEQYPEWDNVEIWRDHLSLYMALAEIAEQRKMVDAIEPLLKRACFGDPGETMRTLRHYLEGIANPDWKLLANICAKTAVLPHKGARLWSLHQLGVLRDRRVYSLLSDSLQDDIKEVRIEAGYAINMLCQTELNIRLNAILLFRNHLNHSFLDDEERELFSGMLHHIKEMGADQVL